MKSKHLIYALTLSPLLFLAGCGLTPLDEGSIWTPSPAEEGGAAGGAGTFAPGTFTPGTFTGIGTGGFGGDITVEVTFESDRIVNIEVVDHNETQSFMDQVDATFPTSILENQSTTVDGVSGATMTADAVRNAVEDAMKQAHTGEGLPTHTGDTDHVTTGNLSFTPGTFTGTGTGGFGGDITVEVTFESDRIASIEVVDHNETQSFMDQVEPVLLDAVITNQSIDVDTVSGATMTSDAVKNAIEDAMAQATDAQEMDVEAPVEVTGDRVVMGVGTGGFGGDITVEVTFDGDQIVAIEVIDHDETPSFLERVVPIIPDAIIESQSTDVDTVSGATMTVEAIKNAVEDALAQHGAAGNLEFTPGTFTGVGTGGFGGDITVEVTFETDRIVDIQLIDHDETPSFVDRVVPILPDAIIENQSVNVDSISGATMTVDAVKNAVIDAMNQAKN